MQWTFLSVTDGKIHSMVNPFDIEWFAWVLLDALELYLQ